MRFVSLQIPILDFGKSEKRIERVYAFSHIHFVLLHDTYQGSHRGFYLPGNQNTCTLGIISNELRVWIKGKYSVKTSPCDNNIDHGRAFPAVSPSRRHCVTFSDFEVGDLNYPSDPGAIRGNHIGIGSFSGFGQPTGLCDVLSQFIRLKIQLPYGISDTAVYASRTSRKAISGVVDSVGGNDNLVYLFRCAGVVIAGLNALKDGRTSDDGSQKYHPSFANFNAVKNLFFGGCFFIFGIICMTYGIPILVHYDREGTVSNRIVLGGTWCLIGIIMEIIAGSIAHV